MRSLGTRRIEVKPINNISTLDMDDSTKPGKDKDFVGENSKKFDDTVPCEDIDEIDAFETQVVDFGDETQPVDLVEETQVMDLAGETQVMDDCDYDFIEHMDTQLLDVSDAETECLSEGEREGVEGTQLMDDVEEVRERSADEMMTGNGEDGMSHSRREEGAGGATMESLRSDDTARCSGSLRRGFTAIRTTSFQGSDLEAWKMASKNADDGSCSTEFSSRSSKLCSLNSNNGIPNAETVDVGHDKETNAEKLSNENGSKVAKSLARTLFKEGEEEVAEEGSSDSLGGKRTVLSEFPACDNVLGGLSYVDSQEPGDLSQANALQFVDKFLKISVLESDQDMTPGNAVDKIVDDGKTVKGPQSLVQQANFRSVHAETSVFEWDDTREDDGGGEFFIKKKDELFGTNGGTRKSCTKPRSSRHHEQRGSQSVGKGRNEKEKQNIRDEMIVHSDSKLMKIRKIEQVKKISVKKKVDDYTDQQLGLDDCGREVLAAEPNVESVDMLNVGIDTQMAAEAMEVLATGNALDSYGINMADEDQQNRSSSCRRKTSKGLLKQSCVEKRTCLSKSGVVTRSQQTKAIAMKSGKESKCFVASRTRSQYAIEELNIDVVKQKGSKGRLPMKNICSENGKNSSGRGTVDNSFLEREHIRGVSSSAPVPVRRRSLRSKVTSSTPVAWKTRQHLALNHFNDVDDATNCSRGQGHCLDMIQASRKRKHSKVRDLASENANTSGESSILATARGGSGNKKSLVMASGTHEAVLQPISRRTRSKRSALCADIPQEGEHVHARAVVSVEDVCQLSLEKNTACSPTAKGAVSHAASEGSLAEVQKSASTANITPPNLKTPTNAASPICVGDGYSTPSCKKMLSLKKEINRLTPREPTYSSPAKELRQRRDMNNIRVLFSQHLDEDVTRQQKRILSRLGVSVASSISDATHFVADTFVRTRNILEAIAHGKPVVTHLWLESCGQASCFIDEKNYILRDAKKERELGFNMPISLARASRHPLLEGRRVFITPHIKPSKEIISSLVKAVHGQAIERLCRFMPNNDRIPEDLLVLSCEEDFEECMPLLEKGIEIYSSELLLKGIITQKLEYGRYRIFMDHVKKTRSTLWLKKGGEQFLPVTRTR